jgi:hypothetical protein
VERFFILSKEDPNYLLTGSVAGLVLVLSSLSAAGESAE